MQRGATTQIAGTGNVKVVNPHEAAKAQPQQVPWYAFWRSKKVPPKPTGEGKENEEKEPLLGEPQVDEEAKTDVSN